MGVARLLSMSFANKRAWEERYQAAASSQQQVFEWYCPYETVASQIETLVGTKADDLDYKVLVVGCGISAFASDLSKAGLKDVTAMDYSSSAIGIQKKNNSRPGLKFEVGDVRDMRNTLKLDDCSFDAVFAKGTIDALLCAERANSNISNGMKEINRVLKSGGKFCCISYANEDERARYFTATDPPLEKHAVVDFPRPSIKFPGGLERTPENMLYMHVYTKK